MRVHEALLYRRRLAEYYANCPPPAFPILPPQLRRPIQSYDTKLLPPARPGSPPIVDGNGAAGPPTVGVSCSHSADQSSTSLISRGCDHVETQQTVSPSSSMPLLGTLFSYLHPSLAAAATTAMAQWYLGAGPGGGVPSRPPPTADPLLTQRAAGQVPDWVVRLHVEYLLRARSAAVAAAAMTGQSSSSSTLTSGQYVDVDDGPWVRHVAKSFTEGVPSQQPQRIASPDISTSSDVPFRPYLPDARRPTLPADQHRSPDVEPALGLCMDRSDAVSSGSKTPDHEAGSGNSVGGGRVDASDGRNSSELVNMERMVHGLKQVQTAAIEELSKVADSY